MWAAAAAIALALVFPYSRRPAAPPMQAPSETAAVVGNTREVQNAASRSSGSEERDAKGYPHRRSPVTPPPQAHSQSARAETQSTGATSDEPALRIAIPADAMFAPGALPEGMTFVADLSIGADGRVEQLRLVPQPVPLERRWEQ